MMDDADGSVTGDGSNRRRFLKALGALGVTGLAGCGGDGDDTDTTEPDTTEPEDTTAPDTTTEPEDTTEPEPTTEPGTETPEQPLEDDPDPLLQIEGGSLQAGETTTLSGTLTNSYLFPDRNVEVTMEAPNDDWGLSATGDTSFDSIASQGSEDVGWEVTAPEEVDGEFTLEGTVSYETTTDSAEVSVSVPLVIFTPGDAPQQGLEAYFSLDGDTPTNELTGNEAEVVGEPSAGAEGILESAWEFTSDGNAETVADTVISEPLPINGEEATIAAWFNAAEITDSYSRVYHVDEEGNPGNAAGGDLPGPTNGYNIEFADTSPSLSPQYWTGGDIGVDSSTGVDVETGAWFFLVTVVEGNECTFYVYDENGQLDGSPGTGSGTRGQSDMASLIMMCGDARDTPGRMDEVRAYSRALSEDEVEALYLASGGTGA